MTTRTGLPTTVGPGLLAPLKYDQIQFNYSTTEPESLVLNMGYFANGTFLHRVETVYDAYGRESTITVYTTEGPFA